MNCSRRTGVVVAAGAFATGDECLSGCTSTRQQPENEYLQISQRAIEENFATDFTRMKDGI